MKYITRLTIHTGTSRAYVSEVRSFDTIAEVAEYAKGLEFTTSEKLLMLTLIDYGKYTQTMRVPREVGRRQIEVVEV